MNKDDQKFEDLVIELTILSINFDVLNDISKQETGKRLPGAYFLYMDYDISKQKMKNDMRYYHE